MIQNRGPNVWRIMLYDSNNRQANGKPKRISKTFKGSKKEAKMLESEMMKQLKNNNIINTSITFKEFSDKWLEDYAIALAPRTYNEYVKLLAKINLHIGAIKLSELKVGDLAKYYTTLRKNGKKEPENKG